MTEPRKAHYVISTHWDREWRQSFQELRYDLVRLLDRVIAGIEDGRLRGPFITDGQSILIDDYLQIRPERTEQVQTLIQEGKLVVGPWYTMPDEFLPSGESLIRNLLLGRDSVRAWGGKPSDAGYIPDMFGHTSQMPQIFQGCGIKGVFLWRGTNLATTRNLLWRGADGTEIFCVRFGHIGYGDFVMKVRRAFDMSVKGCDPENLPERLEQYLAAEATYSQVAPLIIHDSLDHLEWDPDAYALIAKRMDAMDEPIQLVHSTFEQFLEEALPQRERVTTMLEGELREPGLETNVSAGSGYGLVSDGPVDFLLVDQQWLIEGIAASRVRLKQANAVCEMLLCQWAEPTSSLATAFLGSEYPDGFFNLAWRYLLENHPHDSLGGCSVDQVHKDMEHRFEQSRLIADRLTREATARIAASITGEVGDSELRVVVFNPVPRDYDGVVELVLKIPTHWAGFQEFFGYEAKPGFRIYGPDGTLIPYQRLKQVPNQSFHRYWTNKVVQALASHNITVSVQLAVPALGYTSLTIRPAHPAEPTRYFGVDTLLTGESSMANEHLAVQIETNGSLTLTDQHTGTVYSKLLTFEDSADIGDGWNYGLAANDEVFLSTAAHADVALLHSGPLQTTFRILTTMRVPAEFDFATSMRTHRRVELVIESEVTLRAGAKHIEVKTVVNNTALDHRLRVLFPSGAQAQTYLAENAFDVVERAIALRKDNDSYRELEIETKPQQNWTAVFDQSRGLAVISTGLRETAVRDLPERSLALTLFRGTRRTTFTAGEANGQESGRLTFQYCLQALDGEPDRTQLSELGQRLAAGFTTAQLRKDDQEIHREEVNRADTLLPPQASFVTVEGPAVTTSVRTLRGGLEVRVFNPLTTEGACTVRVSPDAAPAAGWQTAHSVDMESNPLAPLPFEGGSVPLTLGPKQIATVRFA